MGKTAKTKSKVKVHRIIESRTDFFYYAFRNVLLVSIPLLVVSGVVLSHLSLRSSATGSGTDSFTVSISSACTLSSVVDSEHNIETNVGTYVADVGKTTITTLCNDGNGYSVYAVGYSNNEEGNNKLINTEYPQYSIDTGLATSGLTSQWAMKLNNIPDDPSPTPPTIETEYDNTYGIVPSYWTKVASRASGTTDMAEGSSFTTTYAVYASSSQYAGTYNGQVKYLLTHPYSNSQYLGFNEAFAADNKNIITIDGNSYYAMQDMNSAICNTVKLMGEASATQLVDIRDNKLYWIAKLADGHCWMTQNLDFDILADEQDPTKMKTLTSEDTDLTDYSLSGAYADGYSYDSTTGIISWTPADTAKTINFTGTTATGWQSSNTEPYSANKIDDTSISHASLGNYYNWTATIASNNSSVLTDDTLNNISNNPKNSICPKGLRLPTISSESPTAYNSTNEFMRLKAIYTTISEEPLYFFKSGFINVQNTINDNYALYWSSTLLGSGFAYTLQNDNNEANNRSYGLTIRCIAR